MTDDTTLHDLLQEHLAPTAHLSRHRMTVLTLLVTALIQMATVNLTRLALLLPATLASNYRRLQRFFAQTKLSQRATSHVVLHLLPQRTTYLIAIDRTEWHFGRTPINFLVASLVHEGTSFPLVWIVLGKAGSSHATEQRAILRKLFLVLTPERIEAVLADREFIASPFLAYLAQYDVPYGVRIRKNARVEHRGVSRPAESLFADLAVGEQRRLRARRVIYGQRVRLYGLRLTDGPKGERRLLLVAGTAPRLLKLYRKRWGIEVLFAGLKSRGFDFETTHLRAPSRLSLLLGVLTLAYSLAHATGRYASQHVPLRLKRHGRRAQSVFRLGLDCLRGVLLGHDAAGFDVLLQQWQRGSIRAAWPPS